MTTTSGIAENDFLITRIIDAPRELVYRAWAEPDRLAKWWGPKEVTNTCEMDLRPGGRYRIVMRTRDGVEYPIKGVFREIVDSERIMMTMDCSEHPEAWHDLVNPNRKKGEEGGSNPAGEMLTTVTFDGLDGKTKLTIRTRFESVAIRDAMLKMGMNEGWTESLERLQEHIQEHPARF